METKLEVVDFKLCLEEYGSVVSATNNLCTYKIGTDTCQVTHSSIYIHSYLGYSIILSY
jgi:hypothetical protein